MTTRLAYSRTFPALAADAFEPLITVPLERILGARHLVIPAVRRTEQDGVWGRHVGQQRRIVFSDGGSARETLTRLDAPHSFGYTLDDVKGPMVALIATLDGTWAFEPAGTGSRLTWSWDVTPANRAAALALPAFGRVWRGAARNAFDRLEPVLVA